MLFAHCNTRKKYSSPKLNKVCNDRPQREMCMWLNHYETVSIVSRNVCDSYI